MRPPWRTAVWTTGHGAFPPGPPVLHLSREMSAPVLPPVHAAFRAIALTVVPEATSLTDAEWRAAEGIIEGALAQRPAGIRRQLQLLIRVLDLLPLLRYGRRFTALDPASRLAFLDAMQRFPSLLVRRGVWGLRTLVFMGYYGRPEARAAIGYRGAPGGWEARR
jgi:hypothetical protein